MLVLRNCGSGYPGMPELANIGLPLKLLREGVTNMVRISDARISGTAYGTVVLHAAPDAAAGGPLGLLRDGSWVELNAASRSVTVEVGAAVLARRGAAWSAPVAPASGYEALFHCHVLQADRGADFDFLVGRRGDAVPAESHWRRGHAIGRRLDSP